MMGMDRDRAAFELGAQNQRFGQNMTAAQFGNNSRQAMFDNRTRSTTANNAASMAEFDAEMRRQGQMTGDRQAALQEHYGGRSNAINEIMALLSGSQVRQPQFANTPGGNMPGVDLAGLVANNDAQRMQNYQMQSQAWNNGVSGIAGFLGTLSDERAKTDIRRVGETDDGLGVYTYRYKGGGGIQMGLMAQEVEKRKPDAVRETREGIKMVDYRRATA